MDLATIIGLLGALGLFFWSLYSGSGGELGGFWDVPSMILVVGGAFGITLLSVRLDSFLGTFKVILKAFFVQPQKPGETIKKLVKLAETARREGLLSLQNAVPSLGDPFLVSGIQMVVDGNAADTVKDVLDAELEWLEQRHAEGKAVLEQLGKYAPAMGMIGTLVGLVLMLQNMDDPSKIGPGMAIALLTTMYGAVLANMVFLPLADKLQNKHDQEMMMRSIMQAGIMSLQAGDNPRVLEMKLSVFLAPHDRAAADEPAKAGA
ncbi:MAG: MotA/TolQ/ExbB proton channel family protein [Phycisphaerae bacterium]